MTTTSTPRVAIDLQAANGQPTGIGGYAAELVQALRQYTDTEVVPVDWGRDPVMHVPRRLQWQQVELPARARRSGAALLHVTGFDAPLWRPLPTVLTVHDLIGMHFPGNLPPVARFYWSRWLPWSVRWVPHVVADSECTKRDIVRLLGVEPDRVTVTPLAAHERFAPQPADAVELLRRRLALPDRFVLYLGTLEPRKGIDTLLDAWAQIAARHEDVLLVIGGKAGWYAERLHAQAQRLGLAERVRWLDYVPPSDLPLLYTAAEVFVFPSRYEGFGLPPLEAMACGTPVVTSGAASLPEVVGDAGIMIPAANATALAHALHLVLTQPALQVELRRRGLKQSRLFSWQRTALETRAVYDRVLDAPVF